MQGTLEINFAFSYDWSKSDDKWLKFDQNKFF